MRDFSWNYFAMTGDIESYLLYKQFEQPGDHETGEELERLTDEAEA